MTRLELRDRMRTYVLPHNQNSISFYSLAIFFLRRGLDTIEMLGSAAAIDAC